MLGSGEQEEKQESGTRIYSVSAKGLALGIQ